jgi:subtilisin family serine protease
MSDTFDTLTDDGREGQGTLLFFSAGNDSVDLDATFRRPWSMYERCFCVAASTLANDGVTEIKAGYSNFGSTVDFCAPSCDDAVFNFAMHNPPTAVGAQAATIQAAPQGQATPGRPDQQTVLTFATAVGAITLTVATTAGMAVNQAVLIGAPGAAGTENRRITAVNAGANQLNVAPGLLVAHGVGTAIASGPWSYQSDFGGTSYATPVCAGTGALVLSANPELRWDQVRDILRLTAFKIDANNVDPTGRWRDGAGRISTDLGYTGPVVSEFFGFGRINAGAAVRKATGR